MSIEDWLRRQPEHFRAAVVSIDMVGSTSLVGTDDQLTATRLKLKKWIEELAKSSTPPLELHWLLGDLGYLVAPRAESYDDVVLFCDRLLASLQHFNRSRGRLNLLRQDRVHVRLVCHEGDFVNTQDPGTLFSQVFNRLAHEEKRLGVTDHVVVSGNVYAALSADIRSRLSLGQTDDLLGQCYVLDRNESLAALHENERESQGIMRWVRTAIRHGKEYELRVFSYTNESMWELLHLPPNVQVKVLVRSWLAEHEEETAYNKARKLAPAVGPSGPLPGLPGGWFKSERIRQVAKDLWEMQDRVRGTARVDMRFYDGEPLLKGVILRGTPDGQVRRARIGFYSYTPAREEGSSPYVGSGWVDVGLEDADPLAKGLLDAVESRFEQQWSGGRTYEQELARSEELEEQSPDSCRVVWDAPEDRNTPYLFVVTGRDAQKRLGPYIAGEDMIGMRVLESLLVVNLGRRVELEIVSEHDGVDPEKWQRIMDYPGHVVFVCRLSLNHKGVTDHLRQSRFPFEFSQDRQHRQVLVMPSSGTQFLSPMDWEPRQERDFCVIGRCPSPNGQAKWFIVAGIHAMGTWGGCEFMAHVPWLRKLSGDVSDKDFAMLVQCRFDYPHGITEVFPEVAARTSDHW